MLDSVDPEPARILVLNALSDVLVPIDSPVLADENSRKIVREALEDSISDSERDQLLTTLENLSTVGPGEHTAGGDEIESVVDSILAELAERSVVAEVTHTARLGIDPRPAAIHTFGRTRSLEPLDGLDLSKPVRDGVTAAWDALTDGRDDRAQSRVLDAIDASEDHAENVTTRLIAGWVFLWTGEPSTALDLVEEVAQLESTAWDAKVLWMNCHKALSAGEADAALVPTAFFRWMGTVPDDAGVSISFTQLTDSGANERPVDTGSDVTAVETLTPEQSLRIRLRGDLPAFPALAAYYLAIGVVDQESDEVTHVEDIIFTGPETADATETVRFFYRDEVG